MIIIIIMLANKNKSHHLSMCNLSAVLIAVCSFFKNFILIILSKRVLQMAESGEENPKRL